MHIKGDILEGEKGDTFADGWKFWLEWVGRKARSSGRQRRKAASPLVPKGGLEPPRAYAHMALNHARLPIPPLRQPASF